MKNFVLWICLILIVVAAVLLLCGCVSVVTFNGYENADKYEAGNKTFNSGVKKVEINWCSGEIKIVKSSASQISVCESGDADLPEEKRVHTYLDGDVLKIQFWKSGLSSSVDSDKKHLTVEVPDGVDIKINNTSSVISAEDLNTKNVEIDSVSGAVNIGSISSENTTLISTSGAIHADSISSNNIKVVSTSGSIRAGSISSSDASFSTTSGAIHIENADVANMIQCGSVSGSVNVGSLKAPSADISATSGSMNIGIQACDKIAIGTTSGSVDITLAEGIGASVEYSSTSGSVKIEKEFYKSGNKYIIGNGGCDISAGSTSGSLKIR